MRRRLPQFLAAMLLGAATSLHGATAGLISIHGAIGPASASYIGRALKVAAKRHDDCVILQLDTPGGLLDSTSEIVRSFYASQVPTVVYVAPAGANATSAGCFITMAADVAAMAPHTTIGAAHPVSLGPEGSEKMDDVMKKKVENFAATYMQGIAEKRGRNVKWAISAVRESASITAEKALELKVIDIIADNTTDLLKQLDGREFNGRKLHTAGAVVSPIGMSAGERVFQLLWRPEVMLVLMLAAIYGLIGELSSPGAVLPGVVGAIALVLALYMAAVLPVNAAGLALIGISAALFIIDLYAPTHGVLTGGGIIAFFLGALLLFNHSDPAFRLSLTWIGGATAVTAAFFIFVVGAGLRAQTLPVRAGRETMLGKAVRAETQINPNGGRVFIEGEIWKAVSDQLIEQGRMVEVIGVDGLTLKVKPAA